MPQILFIGGTGHIGGEVLHQILQAHPDDSSLSIVVLARSEAKAARLVAKYPRVRTLVGTIDDLPAVEAASRNADIVINTSPDILHDEGIRAILRGLAARAATAMRNHQPKPYYVHTSGASLIWDDPEGAAEARTWDDLVDARELTTLKGTHAVTDEIVRAAAAEVNVANVSPGLVGGLSSSIEHPTPITTPAILTTARAFGSGFQIADGDNVQGWIHVADLARMYMILVDDALATLAGQKPVEREAGLELWGREAYFWGAGENIRFGDLMQALTPVLHKLGVIESQEIKSVRVTDAARISLAGPGGEYDPDAPPPPADSWAMHIAIMYGVNERILPSKMERLGWKPQMGSVTKAFPDVFAEYLLLEEQKA